MAEKRKLGKRGQARRAAVLKAASQLFLEHGFENTSLDMVIAQAGGSRRTIYEQFGNKEGLFAAVVHHRSQVMLAPLNEVEVEGRTPADTLIAFGRVFLQNLISDGVIRVLRLVIAEARRFPDLGDAYYQAGPARARQDVARYFQRQIDTGRMKKIDTNIAAIQFLGLLIGNMHIRALIYPDQLPTPEQLDTHVRQAVSTFLHGVATTPGTP